MDGKRFLAVALLAWAPVVSPVAGTDEEIQSPIAPGAEILDPDPATDDPGEIRRKCRHNRLVVENMRERTFVSLDADPWFEEEIKRRSEQICWKWHANGYRPKKRCGWFIFSMDCPPEKPNCNMTRAREVAREEVLKEARESYAPDFEARFQAVEEDCRRLQAMARDRIERDARDREHGERKQAVEDETRQIREAWRGHLEALRDEKAMRERFRETVAEASARTETRNAALGPVAPVRQLGPPMDPDSHRPTRILYGVAAGLEEGAYADAGPGLVDETAMAGVPSEEICRELIAASGRLDDAERTLDGDPQAGVGPQALAKNAFLLEAVRLQRLEIENDLRRCPAYHRPGG